MGKNMGKIGVFINWLQGNRTNYFLVIVLPLILMFVVYAYILIRSFIIAKLAKTKEEAVASTATVDGLSEEDKRRLAEEYLAELARRQLEAEQTTAPAEATEETPDASNQNNDKEDEQA